MIADGSLSIEITIVYDIPLFQLEYSMPRPECRDYAVKKKLHICYAAHMELAERVYNVEQLSKLDHLASFDNRIAGPLCVYEYGTV